VVFGLSLKKTEQVSQTGKPLALSTTRALKRGSPDLRFPIAGLPQAQHVRKVTSLFAHLAPAVVASLPTEQTEEDERSPALRSTGLLSWNEPVSRTS
jgi:hypothetical protein